MHARFAWLVLLATPAVAEVSIFSGPSGGVGDVRVVDPTGQAPTISPARLQGIVLLPVDFAGRTTLAGVLPDQPRLRTDVPGASRVVLPHGRGSLYRYRRDGLAGAQFGYFVVGPDGIARSVWEIAGTGPDGRSDPIPGRVGVSPDGGAILVGTRPRAGGDLFEIDLDLGTSVNRTAALRPRRFLPGGMRLLSTWGVALDDRGPLRFDRTPAAQAAPVVSPPGSTAFIGFVADGVATSADESTAAVVMGPDPTGANVFVFGPRGPVVRGSRGPGPLNGAGYLPGCRGGPTLALSPDGSRVAWVSDEGVSRESWVRRVSAPAGVPDFQITANARFLDTLNETGTIAFVGLSSLVLLAGERAGGGAIDNADVFRIETSGAGGPSLTNLSLTSGSNQMPFAAGQLSTEDGIYQMPGAAGALVFHDTGAGGSVRTVDWTTGAVDTVLDQVRSLDSVALAGTFLALGVRRETGVRELVRVPVGLGNPGTVVAPIPNEITRSATRASGDFAAVLETPSGELLGRIDLGSGMSELLTAMPETYGPTVAFAPDGSVLATLVVPGGSIFLVWPPAGPVAKLSTGTAPGFYLPGP